MIWDRTFDRGENDWGKAVIQTADGGYALTGKTTTFGSTFEDIWVIKTDSSGYIIWDQLLGSAGGECGNDLVEDEDRGLVLVASKSLSQSDVFTDVWLVKLDSTGSIYWDWTFGGSLIDDANSINKCPDGGFIIAGYYSISSSNTDGWLIKTNWFGIEEWSMTYGDVNHDGFNYVVPLQNGCYAAAGYLKLPGQNFCDAWYCKIDSIGECQWEMTIGTNDYDWGRTILSLENNGYICLSQCGWVDVWLMELAPEQTDIDCFVGSDLIPKYILYPPIPNPFNAVAAISFDLPVKSEIALTAYDISGRQAAEIASGEYPAGQHTAVFDGINLPSGVYFLRLQTGEEVRVQKVVLLK